ncbi:PTS transporter subunit EIIC [Companilactobacillus metriopterae]|uniref:PTS transporter subunit EIIC n=1 Tax=Companilactobacillus metriopterae TaxID=1909267 RepID=UPI00100B7AF1|nr:PTS transporter subunit EIIC [Companilactobacillus metriopterae]
MAKKDYSELADNIISLVGGKENIKSLIHCITRLRFYLKDESIAQTDEIRNLNGVIDVQKASGQYQVVIGDQVTAVYDAVIAKLGAGFAGDDGATTDTDTSDNENKGKRNLWQLTKSGVNTFIGVLTGSMSPLIGPLAASGILKGILAILVMPQLGGLLSTKSTTYILLNAIGDATFFFLPVLVGYTAALKLKADPILTAVVGAVLVHPTLVALAGKSLGAIGSVNFPMVNYSYSIFPMILAAWMVRELNKWVKSWLPGYLQIIFTPLIVIAIASIVTLYVTGPAIVNISKGIAAFLQWLLLTSGWASGLLIGGLYQVMVIFGLHWGIIPLVANDLATSGHSYLNAIISSTMISQGAAVLAVAIKTKKTDLKELGFGAAISAFCGVTEPAIYGVNLKYRRVFISGLIGSAVGGFITGLFHGNNFGFAGSWIGFAAFIDPNKPGDLTNFYIYLAASIASTVVAFVVAYVWGYKNSMKPGEAMKQPTLPGSKK